MEDSLRNQIARIIAEHPGWEGNPITHEPGIPSPKELADALIAAGWITPEDPPTREEVQRMLAEAQDPAEWQRADALHRDWKAHGTLFSRQADALFARGWLVGGPRVPEGLTADRLREIANLVSELQLGEAVFDNASVFNRVAELREWASVLDGTAGVLPVDEEH